MTDLERQSSSVSDINENFRQQCEVLSLVSFYESLKTNMHLSKVLIFEKHSAVLGYPNEVSASVHAGHHTICKFRGRSDPNFIKLRELLKAWITRQIELDRPALLPSGSSYAEILKRSLECAGPESRTVTSSSSSPCLLTGPVTGSLRRTNSGNGSLERRDETAPLIFWMIGLPGKGKTVLSARVVNYLQSDDHKVQCHLSVQPRAPKTKKHHILSSFDCRTIGRTDPDFPRSFGRFPRGNCCLLQIGYANISVSSGEASRGNVIGLIMSLQHRPAPLIY